MKYIFIILLLSSANLAWSQSTEIGLRTGTSYNSSFLSPVVDLNYFSLRSGTYIHFASKKRISYELSISNYNHKTSKTIYHQWFDVDYPFNNQIEEDRMSDNFFDISVTAYYDLHKDLPFEKKKFKNYIGFSAGLILNTGKNLVKYSYPDTSLTENFIYSPGSAIAPIFGINYLATYSLSEHFWVNGLVSAKISTNSERDNEYIIYEKPNRFIQLQFGIGYKF